MIHLISPFPISAYPQAWKWLQEFPKANFDDYGPKNYVEFVQEMTRRNQHEQTWGVVKDYEVCGIVGYCPLTPRAGSFHGICFPLGKLSRGEKFEALQLILKDLWQSGVDKISASFFADNYKIYKLKLIVTYHFIMLLGLREVQTALFYNSYLTLYNTYSNLMFKS